MHSKIQSSSQIGGWFIKMILDENSLRKNLFSLNIHVQSKWTFTVRNVSLSSGFRRISRPKLCFWVIRPRIIFRRVRDQFYFGLPFLFLFIFILTHFFLWVFFRFIFLLHFFMSLFSIFVLLLLTHISRRGELNNFWNFIFPHICLSASGIWSLIAREEISLCLCPQCGGWSLVEI